MYFHWEGVEQPLQGSSVPESSPYPSTGEISPLVTPLTNFIPRDTIQEFFMYHGYDAYNPSSHAGPSNPPQRSYIPKDLPPLLSHYWPNEAETFGYQTSVDDLMRDIIGITEVSAPPVPPPPPPPQSSTIPQTVHVTRLKRRRIVDASGYDHLFRKADQRELRKILDTSLSSEWLATDGMEPTCGKRSILSRFLSSRSSSTEHIRCLFDQCKYDKFDRLDRAVAHIRVHLGHRPFVCNGECTSRKCCERFASAANLHSHITRKSIACENCGKPILPQNMRRHLKRHY